ncbi:MAG: hypothetical protein LKM39_04695 [Chiayiivirga sp.]|jgi:hypothetical protein|nr:hypothetical protein [Chiayiivirga sp.]
MNDDSADVALMTRIRARLPVDGPTLGRNAFEAGLAVTRPDGHRQPIPVGAMPVILDDAEIMRRAALARHLVAATARTARWLMAGSNRHLVLAALSPVERRLVEATWSHTNALAVARVDFLVNAVPLALEVNATIPAMQGYSDIAAEQWLRTFAADRPDLDDLIHRNGSNTAALLDALREIHAQRRDEPLSHLGVLCRRGDAQLTELEHLAAQFEASGVETQLVFSRPVVPASGLSGLQPSSGVTALSAPVPQSPRSHAVTRAGSGIGRARRLPHRGAEPACAASGNEVHAGLAIAQPGG